MTAESTSYAPRTYGNWRRPTSAGLGALGALGTVVLLVGLVVVIGTLAVGGLLPATGVAAGLGLVLAAATVRDRHHRSGIQRLTTRLRWTRTRHSGANLYRSGPVGRVPGGNFRLPGLAAASTVSEWVDTTGRPFALIVHPATRHATVVLVTEPEGGSLVDQEQVDLWVARWGSWLASLGHEPGLVAASVTVETAPDYGLRVRAEVETHLAEQAPERAKAMLIEAVRTAAIGSATVASYVALTYSTAGRTGGRRRFVHDIAREIASRLPSLAADLQAAGAGIVRPAGSQELAEMVLRAYDPLVRPLLDATHAAGVAPPIRWADTGPAAAQAGWGWYRHDGSVSITWSMTAAPRGEVFSSVLAELLGPHPDVDHKRVTLLYRPVEPAEAARLVERDKRNAAFRASSSGRPSARIVREQGAAELAAEEEARGAGLVGFGLLVTATVTEIEALDDARAAVDLARSAVDNLAATARIQLRPVYGSQDTAFAAALPLGLLPEAHATIPREFREAW